MKTNWKNMLCKEGPLGNRNSSNLIFNLASSENNIKSGIEKQYLLAGLMYHRWVPLSVSEPQTCLTKHSQYPCD